MISTTYSPKENGNLVERNEVKLLNRIISGILIFVIIFSIYSLIATKTYIGAEVDGPSMYPTINATKVNDYAYYTTRKQPKKGDIVVIDYHYAKETFKAIKRLIATGGDTVCFFDNGIYVNGKRLNETYLDDDYKLLKTNKDVLEYGEYTSADEWEEAGYEDCKSTFEQRCEWLINGDMPSNVKVSEFFKNYSEKYSGSVYKDETTNAYTLKVPDGFVFFLGDNRGGSLDSSELGPAEVKYMVGKVDFITSMNASFIERFSKQLIYLFS